MKLEHTHEGLLSEMTRAFNLTIPERQKLNEENFTVAEVKQVVINGQLVDVKVYKKKENKND